MLLSTARLTVRDLRRDDLDAVHQILDRDLDLGGLTRPDRARWLDWTVLDYEFRRRAWQPPYGEYGVDLTETGALVGLVGLVPCLGPYGQLPGFGGPPDGALAEVGLFWAVGTPYQRRGFATEAARAMIEFAFTDQRVHRVIATTENENAASIAVMRSVGMRVETNPAPTPFWLQAVGWLDNPDPADLALDPD